MWLTLCDPMDYSTPGFPVLHHLLEFAQTHVHWVDMPSYQLILCRPLLLLPSIFPSIRVFSNESALCIMWPKYCIFSFSISPANEFSGLISFRIDWFDLFAVQGTYKSLLQHHSSKHQFWTEFCKKSYCLPKWPYHFEFPTAINESSSCFKSSWAFAVIGALASVLPMNIQGWFPLGLTGLISLQSKGLSRVFSSTTVQKLLFLK